MLDIFAQEEQVGEDNKMKKQIVLTKNKEQIYRGKQLEDLKKMDVREAAKYLPSGSRRYILRNFNILEKFILRAEKKISRKPRWIL